MAGISNAETLTVQAPSNYIDNVAITSGTPVTINVYTGGSCVGGVLYKSDNINAGTSGSISGTALAPGSYSFVANAKVGNGSVGGCSLPVAYTWAGVAITGPTSVPEKTTATYTATGCATPVWSVLPTIYASISSGGLLTTLDVPSNQDVTVKATCGTDFANQTVTITNVASTTPGAPSIGNIVR